MKKHILFTLSIVLLAACAKDYEELNIVESPVLQAVMENGTDTKVHLNESLKSRWDAGDCISVFGGTTYNQKYTFQGSTGDADGTFSSYGNAGSGSSLNAIYAVYPYNSATAFNSAGLIEVQYPSKQDYEPGSYGKDANTMVAVTSGTRDRNLQFKNLCGYLRVSLYGCATVTKITLKGNNSEKISGLGYAQPSYSGSPTAALGSSARTAIVLNCGDGVDLGTKSSSATDFYFVVPPVTFSKGFTITVTDSDGTTYEKSTDKSVTITRNKIQKMAAVKIEPPSVPGVDLSASGSANSYIVSYYGTYKFKTVKGNSSTSVGSVASVEVLWESFGTSIEPSVGDLVNNVSYASNYITFTATSKKGNAVIAAKNSSGTILWSWHIWLTDKPEDQVYNNNAGTMMDRNLGATSATPGSVGALGLLYQWGRKDPFLGSSSLSSNTKAASTYSWPSAVESDSSNGTIAYAVSHPTTFIKSNSSNNDWYYTGSSSTDNTRWQTSDKDKGLYDPCPPGYRVPDGGSAGWSRAFGVSESWTTASNWDSTYMGMNFGTTDKKLGSSSTIWYPASGYLYGEGLLSSRVGSSGCYWSASPCAYFASYLYFQSNGLVGPFHAGYRAKGHSVRCARE